MRRTLLVLIVLASISWAAEEAPWYAKKDTWQETLDAAREAFAEHVAERSAASTLPDFGREPFTVAAWIQTKRGGTIVARAPATGKWAPQAKALFVRNGRLCYDIGWVGCVESKSKVADGTWHHVAMSMDGKTIRLYVDGKLDKSGALKSGPDVAGHMLKLGAAASNFPRPQSPFVGLLDEVFLYRGAVPAKQVRTLAEVPPSAPAAKLVAHWALDGNLKDSGSGKHHGAAVGTVHWAEGKVGQALKLDSSAHATVGDPTLAFNAVWALLKRDFGKSITPLFDGYSFGGWRRRNRPGHGWGGVWEVSDGAIDGRQEWPGSWSMLASRKRFGDFDLYLDVKTHWPVESEVLLREAGREEAYQVTLHTREDGEVGSIVGPPFSDIQAPAKGWAQLWKKDGWNRLRIRIQGNPPTIRTWLNGKPMAELKDPAAKPRLPDRGHIGLTVHGDEDCFNNHAFFRGILLVPVE